MGIAAVGVDVGISAVALVGGLVSAHWVMVPGAAVRTALMGLLGYFAIRGRNWATATITTFEGLTVIICSAVMLAPKPRPTSSRDILVAIGIVGLYTAIGVAVMWGLWRSAPLPVLEVHPTDRGRS
ncbi:MAG TPA: hypothetical protein VF796_28060 [Humisphaera sp.]